MVMSKRCKICTTLDQSNIPISGEYCGRRIPTLIEKVSGAVLDSRKLNGVLLCEQCSIMLVHMEVFMDKLKRCMKRLQPTLKTKKPKIKDTNVFDADMPRKTCKSNSLLDTSATLYEQKLPIATKKVECHENIESERSVMTNRTPKKNAEISKSVYNSIVKINGHNRNEDNDSDQSLKRPKVELNCVLCGKVYHQKNVLRKHIESGHMGEKLKECPNCFMEFRSVQKFESHVFSEKCNTTLCACQFENCNRRFKNLLKMEKHMKEKHYYSSDS